MNLLLNLLATNRIRVKTLHRQPVYFKKKKLLQVTNEKGLTIVITSDRSRNRKLAEIVLRIQTKFG